MNFSNPTTNLFKIKIPGTFDVEKNYKYKNNTYKMAVLSECHFYDLYKFVASDEARKAEGKNASVLIDQLYNGDSDFKGGTYKDLVGEHKDFSQYEKAVKQISTSKLFKSLADKFDLTSARKRVRSAYDGEWDYDKRFDIEPFTRREVKANVSRIVKLNVNSSYAWTVSSDQINKFSGFISAIINLLERNGFLVELRVLNTGTNFVNGSGNTLQHSKVIVKKADEYMPLSKILKVLSSVWYRRAGFALIVSSAEVLDSQVSMGLGTPYNYGTVWENIDDEIFIYSPPTPETQDKILEDLIKMIGERQNKKEVK